MYKLFKISGNTQDFPEFDQFHRLSTEFLPFAQKKLGFDKPVSVNLLSDPQNAKDPLGKTAYYEPEKMKITLFVDKRHVKDILRSMAHELVHHTQNCRGEFKGGLKAGSGYAQEDGKLREMEREAYEKGQMMLRDWEDTRGKNVTENKQVKAAPDDEVVWETACMGAVPRKAILLSGRQCEDALKKSWPDDGTCWFVPVYNAEELMASACAQLNDEKRIAKRKEMLKKSKLRPSYVLFHDGPLRGKRIRVTGFDHAYQWAQALGVYEFYYEGRKNGKPITKSRFKTDLYEYDPTRTGERKKQQENTTMNESEEKEDNKELCAKCKKLTCEVGCSGKTLEEADDKATVQKQLEKWEKKCAKPGANKNMCRQKINLLKARLKKLNEDSSDNTLEEDSGEKKTKWTIDGDIVHCPDGCTKKDAERRVKKAQDARAKGDERRARAKEKTNEGWTSKKDQLLFERLVKKWTK